MEFPDQRNSESNDGEGEVTDSAGGSIGESEEESQFIYVKSLARKQKSMVNIKRKQKCMSRVMSKVDLANLSVKMPSAVMAPTKPRNFSRVSSNSKRIGKQRSNVQFKRASRVVFADQVSKDFSKLGMTIKTSS